MICIIDGNRGVKYLLVASINNGNTLVQVMCVKASGARILYIYIYIIIYIYNISKGLGQRFEERRRGRPAEDVFNIIQKIPNTVVHLKVDEAMEGCTCVGRTRK